MATMDLVNIFIINYNGEKVLRETIQSVKNQDYPNKTITLIDDGSTDRGVAIVQRDFPDVEIIGMGYNSKNLNRLRRLAIENSASRYVFIVDNDIVLEDNCLTNLMSIIKSSANIGICTPRLMYYEDRKKIYVCWTELHFLCTSISPKRDTYTPAESAPVDTVGGGVMLIDKDKIKEIGTINDSYPMGWGDDAEIYIRMKIAGYRTVYVPNAIGYHHIKEWSRKRYYRAYGQVYNRWAIILSMYQIKTIITLFPAFLVYELSLSIMFLLKKLPGVYLAANLSVLKHINILLKERQKIQSTRRVPDKEFLSAGPMYILPAHLTNPLYKSVLYNLNKIFQLYWKLI